MERARIFALFAVQFFIGFGQACEARDDIRTNLKLERIFHDQNSDKHFRASKPTSPLPYIWTTTPCQKSGGQDAVVEASIYVRERSLTSPSESVAKDLSVNTLAEIPSEIKYGACDYNSSAKNDKSFENEGRKTQAEKSTNKTKPLELDDCENTRQEQNVSAKLPPRTVRYGCNNILSSNVVCNGSSDEDEDLYGESRGHDVTSSARNAYHQMGQTEAVYPNFSDKARRALSFRSWSNPHRGSTSEASEAGLFYPGSGSDLLCHYCGAAVQQLTSSDDAWIEHARVNPRCQFVRSAKGEQFIIMVQEMYSDDIDESILERALNSMELDGRRQFQETNTDCGHKVPSTGSVTSDSGQVLSTPHSGQSSDSIATPSASTDAKAPNPLPCRTQPVPRSTTPATRLPRRPRTPKRQVQAREVRARLDLDWAQELLKRGYSIDLLGAVIAEQLIYEGDDFKSFKDMLMATVDAADQGDSYPVKHYALGLSQNDTMSSSGVATKVAECAGAPQASRSACSNSVAALSTGATSWMDTTPPSGHRRNTSIPCGQSNNATAANLITQNRELKERKMCKICYETDASMVFLPCGHLVVCENCSSRVRECPLCRKTIRGVLKTYLA